MVTLLLIGLIVEWVPESYAKQALGGGTVQSLLAVAAGHGWLMIRLDLIEGCFCLGVAWSL